MTIFSPSRSILMFTNKTRELTSVYDLTIYHLTEELAGGR